MHVCVCVRARMRMRACIASHVESAVSDLSRQVHVRICWCRFVFDGRGMLDIAHLRSLVCMRTCTHGDWERGPVSMYAIVQGFRAYAIGKPDSV